MSAELAACKEEALTIGSFPVGNLPASAGPYGVIIGMAAQGLVGAGLVTPKVRAAYVRTCMQGRGYVSLELSEPDKITFDKQPTEAAVEAWIDAYNQRPDQQQRVAAAAAEAAKVAAVGRPTLPQASDEPLTIGAVRFDPAALVPASTPVTNGMIALSGPIRHRGTARVVSDVRFGGHDEYLIPAGAVMLQDMTNGHDGIAHTFWCGELTKNGGKPRRYCLWDDHHSFTILANTYPTLIGAPKLDAPLASAPNIPLVLEMSPTDLAEPINLAIVVTHIGGNSVSLSASAYNGPLWDEFWTANIPWDADGKAVLPFWTHRLTLTRSGAGVSATWTADGDGGGWPPSTSNPSL